ncbi:MAG: D-alanyl-D-alanine carboxypeptidase/D-alanyl-D-alanine-endopeptidase [Gallionella sp.]|nr:D-alanyl-D-alanine carboxypeptidase/D-alanyl-D-alanine-endopeptidase [Gallionella sp.]
MSIIPKLIAALLFSLCLIGQAAPATLPDPVRDALKRANIPLSSIGIVVQQTDARTPLLSLNANQAMNPASTIKLLTTFASLETLGPAYQWKTDAYLDGKLENGVLQGNLVFKGYGDPKLTLEQFWLWLRELRQRGLRDIRGDIVLDRSYFEAASHDPAEFDNDPTRAYNVGPNALLLNFNALRLRLAPDAGGTGAAQTSALLEPHLSGYRISNRITTAAQRPCSGGDTYKARLEERSIVLEGTIPVDCGEVEDYFSLLPHSDYFFAVFSSLWNEMGGTLQGGLREGSAPADQAAFSTHLSPPLSEVIRDINKFSNNTMARQLFLTLGATAHASMIVPADPDAETAIPGGAVIPVNSLTPDTLPLNNPGAESEPPATPAMGMPQDTYPSGGLGAANIERSTEAVQQWLNKQQLHFPELVLENGAGLSRKERISPQHLAELLKHATDSPFAAELEASLPILGMDGSVKKRLKDSEAAGYAHLKTGTLEGVKSIAGYVKAQSGRQWIAVFIINHPNAAAGQDAQDALIDWLQKKH